MAFTLPNLPYAAAALEPHIDARTMEIHHGKHHAAYVNNANKALEGTKWAGEIDPNKLIAQLADVPENIRTAVRNNAGGHANHSLFWEIMAAPGKGGGGEPTGDLKAAIEKSFGELAHLKDEFAKAAAGRFGSGWAWLVVKNGAVSICSTPNQDSPLMGDAIAGCSGTPILGLDVWEHAYYLNYQNRRPDYVTAWWNVVNWSAVAERYAKAR
ncbi:MAG: Fe-Mn family superoxide dismutase [Phycisphaerales bacterium]|jgi:Fe-Mn family superoxide dismutase|nr:Fe-Mn family superoxide dismutase [Phycisphaerales bacterium]